MTINLGGGNCNTHIPDPWWSGSVHVQYLNVKRYHEESRQYPSKNNPGKSHSKPAQRDVCGNDSHLSGPELKRNRPPATRLGQCRSHESDPGGICYSRFRDRNHNNRSDRGLQDYRLLFPPYNNRFCPARRIPSQGEPQEHWRGHVLSRPGIRPY